MGLSNTATPKYYAQFREEVLRGNIPVCKEISMEMNRIDDLIANRESITMKMQSKVSSNIVNVS